jgi:hypothetical protein
VRDQLCAQLDVLDEVDVTGPDEGVEQPGSQLQPDQASAGEPADAVAVRQFPTRPQQPIELPAASRAEARP